MCRKSHDRDQVWDKLLLHSVIELQSEGYGELQLASNLLQNKRNLHMHACTAVGWHGYVLLDICLTYKHGIDCPQIIIVNCDSLRGACALLLPCTEHILS